MLPMPLLAVVQDPPAVPAQVQVKLLSGPVSTSWTRACGAASGPLFVATSVYVSSWPATGWAGERVLVRCRSAFCAPPSTSVVVLSARKESTAPAGGVTVAVFESGPVVPAGTVAVSV